MATGGIPVDCNEPDHAEITPDRRPFRTVIAAHS